ncbi:MAG: glycosyltransferase family 39 protein [Gemmatimonadetes bacterium]|nr:glycosyltransferase family 39 protein [Gemmatimonadota bacterium]
MIDDRAARRFVLWAGAILGLLTFVWLFPGLKDVGIAWDEPYYFDSSRRIQDWASRVVTGPDRPGQFSQDVVRETFNWRRYWNPHPPAYKLAMAATEAAFGRWTGEVVGFRLTPLAFFSLLVACVAWLAGLVWGRAAGIGAGLSLLLMPRVVGHAHIGATDTVTAFAWFVASAGLVLYVLEDRRRYLAIGSAALGLALATKFTGYLMPLAMLLWLIAYGRSRRAISGAILWGLGGLAVAWALNPLMWHDPVAETIRLVRDSLGRDEVVPISTYYLGRIWNFRLPGHHVVVMTLITVPLSIVALAGWGTVATARHWEDRPVGGLCLTQILFFLALLAAPGSPNHDGVRLWLPMFPFLALLAGRGFASMSGILRKRVPERNALLASLILGVVFFLPPYLQTVRVAPLYLAYYNEVIGGVKGAERAGMESTYWLEAATPAFLEKVGETLPVGARLAVWPNVEHFQWIQTHGMLRSDIIVTDEMPPEYFLLVARRALFRPYHKRIYENVRPQLAVELDGVELVGLYAWESGEEVEPDPEDP